MRILRLFMILGLLCMGLVSIASSKKTTKEGRKIKKKVIAALAVAATILLGGRDAVFATPSTTKSLWRW